MQFLEPRPSTAQKFAKSVGSGLSTGLGSYLDRLNADEQNRQQEEMMRAEDEAIQKETGTNLKGIRSKELRKQILEARHDMRKFEAQRNEASTKAKLEEEKGRAVTQDMEKKLGLPEGSLQAYAKNPALAQKLYGPDKLSQSERPISPEQLDLIRKVRSSPGFDDMDEIGQYRALTDAGVSRTNADVEAKLKSESLARQSKSGEKEEKELKEYEKAVNPYISGLEIVEEMDKILKSGSLGILSRGNPSSQAQKQRKKFQQYGKSILTLISSLPIRNQHEFDFIVGDLGNPDLMDSQNEGVLESLMDIFQKRIQEVTKPKSFKKTETKPSLESFFND